MRKRHKGWVMFISFLAALVLLAVILVFMNPMATNQGNDSDSIYQAKNYCSNESRTVQACYEIYQPVCGYFSQDIKCATTPCAQNFSNSCFACMDNKVEYWTSGECSS